MNKSINKKSVLITGCSSGIGLDSAQYLTQKGFHVIASVRQEKDIEILTSKNIECIQLDLNETASIDKAVDYIKQNHPDLYGLVNNGAYGQGGAVEDLSRQALREQFETNVFGTHELTQKIVPLFHKNNIGRIVQISSVLGFIALPMRGAYNASKFALEGLTDTQRLELSETNIKVSLIQPGPIETKFRSNSLRYFLKHVDPESSRYKKQYLAMEKRLNSKSPANLLNLPKECLKTYCMHLYLTNPKYVIALQLLQLLEQNSNVS